MSSSSASRGRSPRGSRRRGSASPPRRWPEAIHRAAPARHRVVASMTSSPGEESHDRAQGDGRPTRILAGSGPECLALYRKRIEAQAQRLLEAGDAASYRRLVEELFCSTQAVPALGSPRRRGLPRGADSTRPRRGGRWSQPPRAGRTSRESLVHPDPPTASRGRGGPGQTTPRPAPSRRLPLASQGAARRLSSATSRARRGDARRSVGQICRHPRRECQGTRASRPARTRDWNTFGGDASPRAIRRSAQRTISPVGWADLCRGGPRRSALRTSPAASRRPDPPGPRRVEARRAGRGGRPFHPVLVGHTDGPRRGCPVRHRVRPPDRARPANGTTRRSDRRRCRAAPSPCPPRRTSATRRRDRRRGLRLRGGWGLQTIHDIRPDPEGEPADVRPPGRRRRERPRCTIAGAERRTAIIRPSGGRASRAVDPTRKEYAVFEGAPRRGRGPGLHRGDAVRRR